VTRGAPCALRATPDISAIPIATGVHQSGEVVAVGDSTGSRACWRRRVGDDLEGADRGRLTVDQLLTVKEAAQRLACSEAAVRRWLYQRRLPAVKVGRLVRLRAKDLEAVITKGVRPASAPRT
jgi:excisionase family DNA binding protein